MAPTIQTQAQREDGHRPNSHRTLPERSGVVCRVKYCNSLPDIPFDSDPAPKDTSGAAALEMMSQAMIRGMMDEEGNQFVAYFLPVEETLKKRKRDQEEEMDYAPDDVYDYKIAREYNWNVKNKASKGSDEEQEKGSSSEKEGSEDEHSGSESDREEGDRDEASDKSGSGEDESSEDEARAARDKEEIFGSDADSEDDADSDDEDRGQAHRGSDNDSDSGSDGGGQRSRSQSRSRSRSASPFPSGSEHSAQEDGSEAAASDSSEADSDSD